MAVGRGSELCSRKPCFRRCTFIVHTAPFANKFAPTPSEQKPENVTPRRALVVMRTFVFDSGRRPWERTLFAKNRVSDDVLSSFIPPPSRTSSLPRPPGRSLKDTYFVFPRTCV
ncbi:hypothetical protein CCL24_17275 [Pseudomonas congelans]|nr:hypothetical protein CCL24_17275 [Pseudomonas congelans]